MEQLICCRVGWVCTCCICCTLCVFGIAFSASSDHVAQTRHAHVNSASRRDCELAMLAHAPAEQPSPVIIFEDATDKRAA